MTYTDFTLGQLLSAKDETIRRNAISILKQLQKNPIMLPEQCEKCKDAGWIGCCNLAESWHK